MFKHSPQIAQVLGAFGEGTLLVCPWLLDQITIDLLSQAGYDPNEDGKIYTGLRAAITTIAWVLSTFLTIGMVSSAVSILLFIVIGLGFWFLPNLFLSKMRRR